MKLICRLLLPLLLVSCVPVLERGEWEEDTYNALCTVLKDKSMRGGYAVFDCDNTTVLHDVTHTLMIYQIENLLFADAVESKFLYGLPRTDFPLEGLVIPQDIKNLYGGAQPVLVAGDSSGDVAMLTSYPDMKVGLIMNQHRGGEIEALADRHDGVYYSQPVTIETE